MKNISEMSQAEAIKFLDNVQTILMEICEKYLDHSHGQYTCACIQAIKYNILESNNKIIDHSTSATSPSHTRPV